MVSVEETREYVRVAIVEPARRKGRKTVTLTASEVHRGMGLDNRMPAACGALDAGKFLEYAGVTLVERTGPGQGATARWTFAV